MCGIVGILGKKAVAPLIVDALKRLEYRGYDSTGLATLENGQLKRLRAEGKLVNLEKKLQDVVMDGNIGIGHTRWATHGAAVERNAHPHMSDKLAMVHNGIIENFAQLRDALIADGYKFETDTDTEAVVHLLGREIDRGHSPEEAVKHVLQQLKGAFALAVIFNNQPDKIIAARQGPPLAIGFGQGEMFVGSDAIALAPFTDNIAYLEDGDWAVLHHNGVTIYDHNNQVVERERTKTDSSAFLISKNNHRHFMIKEILEQPEVISHTLARYVDLFKKQIAIKENQPDWKNISRISFASCGTAYYATLVAKYWFENIVKISVDNDVASEFRYREPPLEKNSLAIFVSQSGETADTIASLRYCKQQGVATVGVVNVVDSTMAREADFVFPTLAGPEIGVASTKAFTCQLALLGALAISAGRARGTIDGAQEKALIDQLAAIPGFVNQVIKQEQDIVKVCRELMNVHHVLYVGRGTSYPIALEGALKLKELSYIHAEGYAAGELKHGPIALIDETMPVIVVAPSDRWYEKTVSNIQEIAARGGRIILITDEAGQAGANVDTLATIILPAVPQFIAPFIYAIPTQLIAYHTAVLLGTDVDQPRNLAKSVTVE